MPKKVKAIQDMSTELRVIVTQDFEKNYGKCKKKQNHTTCIKWKKKELLPIRISKKTMIFGEYTSNRNEKNKSSHE